MPDNPRDPDLDDLIRLSVFSSIGKSIVSENSIRGILDRVMEHVGCLFAPLNWSILLVDAQKRELVFSVAVGRASDELIGKRIPLDEGVAGWVVRNGKPAIVESTSDDARFSERVDKITGFKTESLIAVPLRTADKVFGLIELINKLDGNAFSAYELRVLSTIADFAAIGIEKAYYLAEAKRLSELDPLTETLNRRGLDRVVAREETRMSRYGGALSAIVADIDEFKAINDSGGHSAGDEVLRRVAATMRSAVRDVDSLARFGGDEFIVVMPSTGPEEAKIARTRLENAVNAAGRVSTPPFSVTLGVHSSTEPNFDLLFRESDRDLYRRKTDTFAIDGNLIAALDEETHAKAKRLANRCDEVDEPR